jgi:hypothetical protein
MTPPSTFQMAPVTQLVAGESRKVMVLARSRAVPTRPSGWRLSKLWRVRRFCPWDELLVDRVATRAGATALTRMLWGASSMARFWVSACPALAAEWADDEVAAIAFSAHMLPMLTMDPPRPASTMPRTTVLAEEEDGAVQFEVGVVRGAVVVQERLEDEESGRVDQQGGVGVLVGQLLANPVHLLPVGPANT